MLYEEICYCKGKSFCPEIIPSPRKQECARECPSGFLQAHTETQRQRDRETERQRDRETERQRDRETERQRDTERERGEREKKRIHGLCAFFRPHLDTPPAAPFFASLSLQVCTAMVCVVSTRLRFRGRVEGILRPERLLWLVGEFAKPKQRREICVPVLGCKFPGPFLAGNLLHWELDRSKNAKHCSNRRKSATNPEMASINVC